MSAVDLTERLFILVMDFIRKPKFSEIVNKHGIKFIGPSARNNFKMGDKIEAKK